MKALVVYDSKFGNTERIARAIGDGLGDAYQVEVRHVGQVTAADVTGLDALVVGSPTQGFNATEVMRGFLSTIPDAGLRGVRVAAFDTRIAIKDVKSGVARLALRVFMHRYAAKPIADALEAKGGALALVAEGFYVSDTEGPLRAGELERATAWGRSIAERIPA